MTERAAAPSRVSLVQALLDLLPPAALGRDHVPCPPQLVLERL
jgi:hypothetical protein